MIESKAGDLAAGRRRRGRGADDYLALVAAAAEEMDRQGPVAVWRDRRLASVVVLPVVGFGHQCGDRATVTLDLLSRAEPPAGGARRLVVAVVNRPRHQPDDGTAALLRSVARELRPALDVVVCEVVLDRKPRIGECRQLAVDAVAAWIGKVPDDAAVLLFDDDLVDLPPGTLRRLEAAATDGFGLAVGPVLFDEAVVRTSGFPALYVADVVRALTADRLLAALEDPSSAVPPGPEVYESLVLSGHLGVRFAALCAVGGFRDLNEVTWLARDVVATERSDRRLRRVAPLVERGGGPREVLLAAAVRVSSRRALAAWHAGRHPTVAQWRGARFHASRIDPVRVRTWPCPSEATVDRFSRAQRRGLLEAVSSAVAVTFDHLRPPVEVARAVLDDVELGQSALRPPVGPGERWHVALTGVDGVLDWLARKQAEDLEQVWPDEGVAVSG